MEKFPCPSTIECVSVAARYGKLNRLIELLEEGHPIDDPDNRGYMSLHDAAAGNHIACMKVLLKHADASITINHQGHDLKTALHLAVEEGHLEAVRLLIQNGADVNLQDHFQESLLHIAVSHGFKDIVSLLLDAGANVDPVDVLNSTPLDEACSLGYADITKMLLDAGASMNISVSMGRPPIFSAVRKERPECLKLLIDYATKRGQTDALNIKDELGCTLFYFGAVFGSVKCLKILLDHGLDPSEIIYLKLEANNTLDNLAFYGALEHRKLEAAKLLLENTDLSKCSQCSFGPFELAVDSGYAPMLKLLLKHVDCNTIYPYSAHTDQFGYLDELFPFLNGHPQTAHPLTIAIYRDQDWAVEILLEAGANCLQINTVQSTPMIGASRCCTFKNYKKLVLKGKAEIDLYSSRVKGNVVLMAALLSVAKTFWLLRCGVECDSLLKPVKNPEEDNRTTLYNVLGEIYRDRFGVRFGDKVVLLLVYCARRHYDLDERILKKLLPETREKIHEYQRTPIRLDCHCRGVIRESLGSKNLTYRTGLDQLRLPPMMKPFLLFNDLKHIVSNSWE